MNLQPYDEKDGKRVWLDRHETRRFIDQADGAEQRIAFLLAARSGLRAHEVTGTNEAGKNGVAPQDVRQTRAGPRVRVWHGKGDKFRETIAPMELVRAVEYFDREPDETLVGKSPRTIERWVKGAGQRLYEQTDDVGWTYLTPHDLRRTWATLLAADRVDPLLVCDWGGWDDLETFLEHYRGTYSPEVQRREAAKVSWIDVDQEEMEFADDDPELGLLEMRAHGD